MKQIVSIFFTFLLFSHLHGSNISWSSIPQVLSGSNVNASDPHVAVDTNGDAVALWVENSLVKASSKTVSGNWSAAVTLSATGGTNPRLVVDGSGNATAVWLVGGIVNAASKPSNGNWSSTSSLSNTGASSPTLCVDIAGNVIAAWARNGNIETSTKLFGMSWQPKSTITSTSSATPSIAIGGTGSNTRAFLIWQGVSSGTEVIFASTKLISGNWSSEQVISEVAHNAAQPCVAVDSNANALAIWYSYDVVGISNSNVVVKSAAWSNLTSAWDAINALSEPGIRNPSTLTAHVAFDSFGNAIALWNISFDDVTFNIEASVKPVSCAWSEPVICLLKSICLFGRAFADNFWGYLGIYLFYNGIALLIQAIESDINGFLNNTWSVPITISEGTDNAYPENCCIDKWECG